MKSFFYGNGQFQPVYFWITVLMVLVITSVIMRLAGHPYVDNSLVLGMLGLVAAWVKFYNDGRKEK